MKKKKELSPRSIDLEETFLQSLFLPMDRRIIFKEMEKVYDGLLKGTAGKKGEKVLQEFTKIHSLKTGYLLAGSCPSEWMGYALELKNELVKEYECKKPSEIMLVEEIVNLHIGRLHYAKKFDALSNMEHISSEKNGYYTMLSKHMDRLQKQYIASMDLLHAMKQPKISLQLKSKNTFLAQNQQFNENNKQE